MRRTIKCLPLGIFFRLQFSVSSPLERCINGMSIVRKSLFLQRALSEYLLVLCNEVQGAQCCKDCKNKHHAHQSVNSSALTGDHGQLGSYDRGRAPPAEKKPMARIAA